jgi:hypothetical protein
MSGFVDAPYATPNPRFKLRSVKQRLYRGRCVNNEYLQSTFEKFREQQQAIEALIDGHVLLGERERKSTLRFVAAFYETIDNPKDVDRLIIGRCLS